MVWISIELSLHFTSGVIKILTMVVVMMNLFNPSSLTAWHSGTGVMQSTVTHILQICIADSVCCVVVIEQAAWITHVEG